MRRSGEQRGGAARATWLVQQRARQLLHSSIGHASDGQQARMDLNLTWYLRTETVDLSSFTMYMLRTRGWNTACLGPCSFFSCTPPWSTSSPAPLAVSIEYHQIWADGGEGGWERGREAKGER